jgi:hypothetical protein
MPRAKPIDPYVVFLDLWIAHEGRVAHLLDDEEAKKAGLTREKCVEYLRGESFDADLQVAYAMCSGVASAAEVKAQLTAMMRRGRSESVRIDAARVLLQSADAEAQRSALQRRQREIDTWPVEVLLDAILDAASRRLGLPARDREALPAPGQSASEPVEAVVVERRVEGRDA